SICMVRISRSCNWIVSSMPTIRRKTRRMSRSGIDTSTGPKSEGDGIVVGIAPSFIRIGLPWFAFQGDDVIGVDFGGGALVPVPVLPLAGAQRPLDEGAAALVQDSRELLRGLLPEDHAVPFDALLALAALAVGPGIGGGHAEGQHLPGPGVSQIWVGAEAADEHDTV